MTRLILIATLAACGGGVTEPAGAAHNADTCMLPLDRTQPCEHACEVHGNVQATGPSCDAFNATPSAGMPDGTSRTCMHTFEYNDGEAVGCCATPDGNAVMLFFECN